VLETPFDCRVLRCCTHRPCCTICAAPRAAPSKESDPQSFTYIGRKSCGCAVAAAVDASDKATADNVASFIRDGLAIERVRTGLLHRDALGDQIKLGCRHLKVGAALL